jgi:hypothetical protein
MQIHNVIHRIPLLGGTTKKVVLAVFAVGGLQRKATNTATGIRKLIISLRKISQTRNKPVLAV